MTESVLTNLQAVADRIATQTLDSIQVADVDLSKLGLAGVRGSDLGFRRIGLHQADAKGCDLGRARFAESSCRGVDFTGSLLRGCSFFSTELIEASFVDCTLNGTSFFSTRMGNADLSGARIQSCTFNSCELFGVRFARSLLLNSRFEAQERGNVTLDRADFSNAVLIDCDLLGSNLFGASFENALLVKVDLRQANLAQANFEGARMIDVQLDLGQFEPGQRRVLERARIEDPWRSQGFMKEVLAPYSGEELAVLTEFLMRTYVIEGASPTAGIDTFAGVLASLKAGHDFPELEAMRVRGTSVQVRLGHNWYDLGAPVVGEVPAPTPATSPATPAPSAAGGSTPAPAPAAAAPTPAAAPEPALPPPSNTPPKGVKRSKRFRNLEID